LNLGEKYKLAVTLDVFCTVLTGVWLAALL